MSPKNDHEARLRALEKAQAVDEEQKKEDRKLLREVHRSLIGEDDKPGLRGRVDRLETKQKLLAHIGGALATFLGLVAAFLGLRSH